MSKKLPGKRKYNSLLKRIKKILDNARHQVVRQINLIQVSSYYEIGREIVEFELDGNLRADYGDMLVKELSKDLSEAFGKGFHKSNLFAMKQFYIAYSQKVQTLSGLLNDSHNPNKNKQLNNKNPTQHPTEFKQFTPRLSWSHYCQLIKVKEPLARAFYEEEAVAGNWSVRQLRRQIGSLLFERVALSKNKEDVLSLAQQGQVVEKPEDVLKDPYVLEFLNLKSDPSYSESELEQEIIDKLQYFLLEMGRGFSFVARQQRITISHRHYYIDLVFYNRLLKCFVLIDLKTEDLNHGDVGQMNMYLNYYKKHKKGEGEGDPIGLILAAEKDEVFAEYVLGGMSNQIFTSKYRLALPSLKQLKREFRQLAARHSSKNTPFSPLAELMDHRRKSQSEYQMILPTLEHQGHITNREVQEILGVTRYKALKPLSRLHDGPSVAKRLIVQQLLHN